MGQTNELLRTRIRRHLTNQRTDAVAMFVLDPFEVYEIEVWPLPQFDGLTKKNNLGKYREACNHLDSLEYAIFEKAIVESEFKAILNEKDPLTCEVGAPVNPSHHTAASRLRLYNFPSIYFRHHVKQLSCITFTLPGDASWLFFNNVYEV